MNMSESKENVLHGERHVTSVKVEITFQNKKVHAVAQSQDDKAPQLGGLGEATLRINENAQPQVLLCRKTPDSPSVISQSCLLIFT